MKLPLLLLAFGAGFFGTGDALPERESVKKLNGDWTLVSTRGAERTDRGSENIRMTFQDSRIILKFHERTTNQGTAALSRSGKTRQIDLRLTDREIFLGIYELKDDHLAICFDEPGKPRPSSLAPGGTQWLETWKRVKAR